MPSVRSKEAEVREAGIVCLGLCCLLDKVCSLVQVYMQQVRCFMDRTWLLSLLDSLSIKP